MAVEIKTEILINATPEKVWSILTNFNDYPSWNPFIKAIKGVVEAGNKITVTIQQTEAKETTFKPRVLTFKMNKEISWLGSLLVAGIFDGAHKLELVDNGNGTTAFKQSELFKGILVPLFKNQLNNNTKKGFEAMNRKLKELSEQR